MNIKAVKTIPSSEVWFYWNFVCTIWVADNSFCFYLQYCLFRNYVNIKGIVSEKNITSKKIIHSHQTFLYRIPIVNFFVFWVNPLSFAY